MMIVIPAADDVEPEPGPLLSPLEAARKLKLAIIVGGGYSFILPEPDILLFFPARISDLR